MPPVCFADTETGARMDGGAQRGGATLIRESQRYTRRLEDVAAAGPPMNLPHTRHALEEPHGLTNINAAPELP